MRQWTLRLGILLAAFAPSAAAAATPMTPAQRVEITRLRREALGDDPRAGREALETLQGMGEVAEASVVAVARALLARDREAVVAASRRISDPAKVAELEDEIDRLRAEARENLKHLAKGEPIQRAREFHDRLAEKVGLLNQVQEVRAAVLEALRRRDGLIALYRPGAAENDAAFGEDREAALRAQAEGILGMTAAEAEAAPEYTGGKGPKDARLRHIWFYSACRAIEAYNETHARPLMSAAEWENVRCVNAYRESLGIMPYEVDARLLQSTRRHSKEMVERGYFSHVSPTRENKTHTKRMANAGYKGGYSENIAAGSSSGEHSFWQWFSSPPHHLNMVNPGSVHMGVGNWSNKWTQNFGRAKRLMLMGDADRAGAAAVKGEIVGPQGGSGMALRTPASVR